MLRSLKLNSEMTTSFCHLFLIGRSDLN
uniref:BMA-YARS-1, isoform h n=1 Tax=Brugia malayi TaxID=6279 RepID=A0A1P6BM12_BRUMA|nr:BMA-YARS-1, isoform h [Brugia malayi]